MNLYISGTKSPSFKRSWVSVVITIHLTTPNFDIESND